MLTHKLPDSTNEKPSKLNLSLNNHSAKIFIDNAARTWGQLPDAFVELPPKQSMFLSPPHFKQNKQAL